MRQRHFPRVLLREGVARLLEESGFDVVGQARDAEDLVRKTPKPRGTTSSWTGS
jgi:DNA-binding NarL/FixJ family response regulator